MDLPTVWFAAIALLWTGYLVLEGFDFGVGMLLPVLGRDDADRRVVLEAIGPVWDGNEVWLITAPADAAGAARADRARGGAGVPRQGRPPALAGALGRRHRGRQRAARVRLGRGAGGRRARGGVRAGRGVRHRRRHAAPLLEPYALLGGLATLALCVLHGAVFLALKTDGPVRHRARRAALGAATVAVPALAAFLARTQTAHGAGWTLPVALLAVAAVVGAVVATARRREGWAFAATAVAVAATVTVLFGSLFPDVLPARDGTDLGLTVAEAAAAPYTLGVLSWIGVAFLPLVLLYQGWSYWVFRARITPAPR